MPKELLNEQNSDLQKPAVVSLNTLNTSASNDRIVESFTEVVYSSTPIAPLLPPNSISSVPSMVEHGLQFQQ